ncbi:hypothetical protein Tco_0650015 [Tanacetum coccineum]
MWIRNLVIRNCVGDLQLGIESYLERPNWDATDYFFKEDYTIVPKPRAVIYRDRNDQRKLMRLNEIHKFSDGTLTRVMEKLDHMVKDFHLITTIEKRLQIRRIFRSLESFVTCPILLSFTHCGNKSILRVLRIILLILPEHPSETKVFHNEDGNPARANIKQALGSCTNRGHQNTFNANAATKNRSSIGWMSKQFYLNGDLQEKSLSSHPEGFEDQDKSTARLSSEEALMG